MLSLKSHCRGLAIQNESSNRGKNTFLCYLGTRLFAPALHTSLQTKPQPEPAAPPFCCCLACVEQLQTSSWSCGGVLRILRCIMPGYTPRYVAVTRLVTDNPSSGQRPPLSRQDLAFVEPLQLSGWELRFAYCTLLCLVAHLVALLLHTLVQIYPQSGQRPLLFAVSWLALNSCKLQPGAAAVCFARCTWLNSCDFQAGAAARVVLTLVKQCFPSHTCPQAILIAKCCWSWISQTCVPVPHGFVEHGISLQA